MTDAQVEILVYGIDILDDGGEGFATVADERAAWKALRNVLMEEHRGPGRRPHGFYRFDLGEEPRRWYDEIRILLKHNLIGGEEAFAIEREHRELCADPGAFFSAFDDEGVIGHMQLGADSLRETGRHFEVAAKWHAWRDRPQLAQTYAARAANAARVAEHLTAAGS